MRAIDKVTKREHAICPVLGGYQVCLIPGISWEDAQPSDVHVFLDKEFHDRFESEQKGKRITTTTYHKDFYATASIKDHPDGTATLTVRKVDGLITHNKRHANRKAALAAWYRLCK